MTDFVCSKCNYVSNRKQNVVKHIRINKCWIQGSEEPIINKTVKSVSCEYCDHSFDTVMGLYKHVNYQCKIKRQLDKKKENDAPELDKLREEVNDLKLIVNQQSEAIKSTNINNTTNNTINNDNSTNNTIIVVNNPVVILSYNDEDLVTNDIIKECIPRKFLSVEYMIKNIHLNPKNPEGHNIYITNKRENEAYAFKNGKWSLMKKDDLFGEIIPRYEGYMEDYANKDPKLIKDIQTYKDIKKRDFVDKKGNYDEKEFIVRISKDINALFINNKEIVANTKKKYEDYQKTLMISGPNGS
jgi:hypothetical protein